MKLNVIDPRPTRIVPCNGCTVCCQGDAIYLHPECGDDAANYKIEIADDGRFMLAHQPNGDCIYLDREKGCTNWNNRPTICREMDCAAILDKVGEKRMKQIGLTKLIMPAKQLRKRKAAAA